MSFMFREGYARLNIAGALLHAGLAQADEFLGVGIRQGTDQIAFTRLKIEAFAPMARASVRTAMAVKPGDCAASAG